MSDDEANGPGKVIEFVTWLVDKAVAGVPPLTSARALADEYLGDAGYADHDRRVDSLIKWETSKNAVSGFLTGVGGLATLPVAVPAALGASWVIQARLVAAVASIYGHDIKEDRVRTLILLSLVGDAAKKILKGVGIQVAGKVSNQILQAIPGRLLIEINKFVGFRLLTKAGTTGIINLVRLVPLLGGGVAASFDAYACRKVGRVARDIFRPE